MKWLGLTSRIYKEFSKLKTKGISSPIIMLFDELIRYSSKMCKWPISTFLKMFNTFSHWKNENQNCRDSLLPQSRCLSPRKQVKTYVGEAVAWGGRTLAGCGDICL